MDVLVKRKCEWKDFTNSESLGARQRDLRQRRPLGISIYTLGNVRGHYSCRIRLKV